MSILFLVFTFLMVVIWTSGKDLTTLHDVSPLFAGWRGAVVEGNTCTLVLVLEGVPVLCDVVFGLHHAIDVQLVRISLRTARDKIRHDETKL